MEEKARSNLDEITIRSCYISILKLLMGCSFISRSNGKGNGSDPFEWGLLLLFASGIFLLGHQIHRTQFWLLFPVYTLLFAVYLRWVKGQGSLNLKGILLLGILFRLLLFGSTPSWSDDLARFVWDGRIVAQGEDPYASKPSELMESKKAEELGLDEQLFRALNSPDYYSVYPPVEQLVFGGTATLAGQDAKLHAFLLRTVLLLADLAVALALMRLLKWFERPREGVGLYFLNPLVIMEGVGNFHFEVLMIAFLLWGLLQILQKDRLWWGGVLIGAAISSKLIPLLFLPFFLRTHGLRAMILYAAAAGTFLLSFGPWASTASAEHFLSSLNLYFQTFEFNPSIYELVRWIGFQWVGYNIIEWAGPFLSLLTFLGVMALTVFGRFDDRRRFLSFSLLALTLQLLLATTVHPWYLLPLLAFLPLVSFRYPLLWAFLAILSYSAYSHGWEVPWPYLLAEYVLLFGMLIYEMGYQRSGELQRSFRCNMIKLNPRGKGSL